MPTAGYVRHAPDLVLLAFSLVAFFVPLPSLLCFTPRQLARLLHLNDEEKAILVKLRDPKTIGRYELVYKPTQKR